MDVREAIRVLEAQLDEQEKGAGQTTEIWMLCGNSILRLEEVGIHKSYNFTPYLPLKAYSDIAPQVLRSSIRKRRFQWFCIATQGGAPCTGKS